jgi:DNA-binding CsgD family transcriptional regulator
MQKFVDRLRTWADENDTLTAELPGWIQRLTGARDAFFLPFDEAVPSPSKPSTSATRGGPKANVLAPFDTSKGAFDWRPVLDDRAFFERPVRRAYSFEEPDGDSTNKSGETRRFAGIFIDETLQALGFGRSVCVAPCNERNRALGLLGIVDDAHSATTIRTFQRLIPLVRTRLRLEAAFRRADRLEAVSRSLLDLVPREVFLCDSDGHIHDANASAAARLATEGPSLREIIASCVLLERNTAEWEVRTRRGTPRGFSVVYARTSGPRRDALGAFVELWDLSDRHRDVLALAVDGCTNRVIATSLGISERTVEVHLSSIYERTGVKSRSELVGLVLR